MNHEWLSIVYDEAGDTWEATIQDDRGRAIIKIKRKAPKDRKEIKKTSGIVGGAYRPANENYESSAIVSPKSPQKLAAEAEQDWVRKNVIEQATKPYEHN